MKTLKQWRDELAQDCNSAGINTVGLNELLDMAATLRHELGQLQSTVDLEGIEAVSELITESPHLKCHHLDGDPVSLQQQSIRKHVQFELC